MIINVIIIIIIVIIIVIIIISIIIIVYIISCQNLQFLASMFVCRGVCLSVC